MKRLPLIILGIIAFGFLAVYVIIPAAIFLIKFLIAAGIAIVFGLGAWLGYSIGKRK
jgi:hypothetical protein